MILTYSVIVSLAVYSFQSLWKGEFYKGWLTVPVILGAGCIYYLANEFMEYADGFRREKK
jgi:hypothetical protein